MSFARRATSCDRPIIELIEKLRNNIPEVVEANFSHKPLGISHIRFLCEAIGCNTNLRFLQLSHCNICDSDIICRIAHAIGESKLVKVDLRHNRISPIRMGFFAEALKSNIHLRVLKFEEEYDAKQSKQMKLAEKALSPFLEANKALYLTIEGRNNVLSLENRRLHRIDKAVATLQHIEVADLSKNRFRSIPADVQWNNLIELNLSENLLTDLPKSFINMKQLKTLDISHNKFTQIPILVSMLPQLESLDISHNQIIHLDNIPLCSLAKHTNLKSFLMHNNPFIKSEYKILSKSKCAETQGEVVLSEIRKLPQEKKSSKIQLFFLGESNQGKTSIIRSLKFGSKRKRSKIQAFDAKYSKKGTTFLKHSWRIFYKPKNAKKSDKRCVDYLCLDWVTVNPLFQLRLSSNSIYILTASLPLNEEKTCQLKQYADTITTTLGETPFIIVVLTYIDTNPRSCVFDALTLIKKYLEGVVRKVIPLSNKTGRGVDDLSAEILQCSHRLPQFDKCVPYTYQYLEENLNTLKLTKAYRPILTSDQTQLLLEQSGIPTSERDLAFRYLHDKGALIYWNTEHISLSDYVVLDYQLLLNLYNRIIVTYSPTNTVLVNLEDLQEIWKDFGPETQKYARAIFERFELFSLTSQDDMALLPYIIPYHTPLAAKALPADHKRKVWRRVYRFSFFPSTLYSRLVNALLGLFPKVLMWQSGLIFTRNAELDTVVAAHIGCVSIDSLTNTVYFEVPRGWPSYYLTRLTAIIEEIVSPYRELQYKTMIPCSHCMTRKKQTYKNSYQFSIIELATLSEQSNPNAFCYFIPDTRVSVPINQLAPDASLKHIKHLLIRSEDLILGEQIGAGTYGRVYKATYHNFTVAVKVLNKLDESSNQARLFAEFRREIQFMSDLHDPHLIQLRGVASLPDFCVVQDYCPAGDLHNYLQEYRKKYAKAPPLGFCLHVAYNIAKGMEYLHSSNPPVLHRDLKSPNVLLLHTVEELEEKYSQYHLNMGVIAKITDFGLSSQCNLPYSSRIVDNPLWLAPEIMDQKPYTKKVDVYSFAIILYELISSCVPFSEYNIAFTWKLEEKIRKENLRPTIPEGCDSAIAGLIEECWHENPAHRPSFKKISTVLLNVMVANHFASELSLNISPYDMDVLDTSGSDSEGESASDSDLDKRFLRRRGGSRLRYNNVPTISPVRRVISLVSQNRDC